MWFSHTLFLIRNYICMLAWIYYEYSTWSVVARSMSVLCGEYVFPKSWYVLKKILKNSISVLYNSNLSIGYKNTRRKQPRYSKKLLNLDFSICIYYVHIEKSRFSNFFEYIIFTICTYLNSQQILYFKSFQLFIFQVVFFIYFNSFYLF